MGRVRALFSSFFEPSALFEFASVKCLAVVALHHQLSTGREIHIIQRNQTLGQSIPTPKHISNQSYYGQLQQLVDLANLEPIPLTKFC